MAVIQTAYELYQLLQEKDVLHLRRAQGRDDALYADLKLRLGCPVDIGLGRWLSESPVSAQSFLEAFFGTAQPLSAMLREIYRGMQKARVVGASELVRIRLEDEDIALDLELSDFVRTAKHLETRLERRTVALWDERSLIALTDVMGWLIDGWNHFKHRARNDDGSLHLAQVPNNGRESELAKELLAVREVLVELVDPRTEEPPVSIPLPRLEVLIGAFNESCMRMEEPIPRWRNYDNALTMLRELPYAFQSRDEPYETVVEVFRQVLDLPVWRFRWYLYEVWTAFQLLRVLEEYAPVVLVDAEGRLALARSTTTQFARFSDDSKESYTVAAQKETAVQFDGRRGICPDYRIERERDEASVVLVECKQRGFYWGHSIEDNMHLYEVGAPQSLVNVFVNYDAPERPACIPGRTHLVDAFRPASNAKLLEFDRLLLEVLERGGILPARRTIVLLDSSGSMKGRYASETHKDFWGWFERQGFPIVYRFSDVLNERPVAADTLKNDWSAMACEGGTSLDGAIRDVTARHGARVSILAVTDVPPSQYPDIEAHFWDPSSGSPSDVWSP